MTKLSGSKTFRCRRRASPSFRSIWVRHFYWRVGKGVVSYMQCGQLISVYTNKASVLLSYSNARNIMFVDFFNIRYKRNWIETRCHNALKTLPTQRLWREMENFCAKSPVGWRGKYAWFQICEKKQFSWALCRKPDYRISRWCLLHKQGDSCQRTSEI